MPKRKTEKTRVLFRLDKGEVVAVFPDNHENRPWGGSMSCYARMGQHSTCSRAWLRGTKPASAHQAAALKKELTKIGYKLQVVKRASSR
jgi:hypothetical protein